MNTYRKNAVIAGILFLICSATTLLSFSFSGSILEGKDYLSRLSASENKVITGALLEMIQAATAAGIAIALYPVLKKRSGALAIGSVCFRVVECVFVLIGTLSLLSLLTLSQEFVAAGTPGASSFQASGSLLLAARFWSSNTVAVLVFYLGALLYYIVLFQSRLIPRWLSGWGALGTIMGLAATVLSSYTQDFSLDSIHTLLNIPIGLQELAFAGWLMAKGFNPKAVTSL